MSQLARLEIVVDASNEKAVSALKQLEKEANNLSDTARVSSKGLEGMAQQTSNLADAASEAVPEMGALSELIGIGVAAALIAGAVLLYKYVQGLDDLTKEQRAAASVTEQMNEAYKSQVGHITTSVFHLQNLVAIAKDANRSDGERLDAIKALNQQYPDLNKQLSLQNINSQETNDLIAREIKLINLRGQARGLENVQAKIAEKQFDLSAKAVQDNATGFQKFKANLLSILGPQAVALQLAKEGTKETEDQTKALDAESVLADQKLKNINDQISALKGLAAVEKAPKEKKEKPEAPFLHEGLQTLPKDTNALKDLNKAFEELVKTQSAVGREVDKHPNLGIELDPAKLAQQKKEIEGIIAAQEKFQKEILVTQRVLEPIASAFANLFSQLANGAKIGLKEVANALKQIVVQIIATTIKAAILAAALAALGWAGPTGAKGFVDIFKGFIVGHAEGGITTSPHLAMVGEAGPEAIIPLNRLSQFGGVQVLIPQITGDTLNFISSRATRRQNSFG